MVSDSPCSEVQAHINSPQFVGPQRSQSIFFHAIHVKESKYAVLPLADKCGTDSFFRGEQ